MSKKQTFVLSLITETRFSESCYEFEEVDCDVTAHLVTRDAANGVLLCCEPCDISGFRLTGRVHCHWKCVIHHLREVATEILKYSCSLTDCVKANIYTTITLLTCLPLSVTETVIN